jgi:putative FmdB family regulatory protein
MPVYVFRCDKCKKKIELKQGMLDDHSAPLCDDCGNQTERVLLVPGAIFVGEDFSLSWESKENEDAFKDNAGEQKYVE